MKKRIYNLANGTIEVYQFEPIFEQMSVFRLRELSKLPEDQQILRKRDTKSWFTPKTGTIYHYKNYVLQELNTKSRNDYDAFKIYRSSYILGEFIHDPVHVYPSLYTLDPYNGVTDYCIQLTEDAYRGYLLETEQFALLDDIPLDLFKNMFVISNQPLSTVSLKEAEKLFQSGLIEEDFNERMNYLEKSSKVYQKLKK